MVPSFKRPGMAGQSPQAEVYPLFPEQAAGPFQSNSTEQNDLHFIQRFGPQKSPVDMTGYGKDRPQESARSALSAADNFIADSYFRRVVRHRLGRRRWPLILLALTALIGAGAAVIMLGMPRLHAWKTAFEASVWAAADSASSRGPLRTTDQAVSVPTSPAATRPEKSVAAPESAVNLEHRLSTSGLPSLTKDTAEAPVKVIAFPPSVSLEADDQAAVASADQAPPTAAKLAADIAPQIPVPAPVAPRPAPDTRKLDQLVGRGEQLLANGEVAAARLFFERAATEGDPRGARGLARSYDENALRALSIVGLAGSRSEAERWYLKAAELEARQAPRTPSSGSTDR